jgi:hypothetical protein
VTLLVQLEADMKDRSLQQQTDVVRLRAVESKTLIAQEQLEALRQHVAAQLRQACSSSSSSSNPAASTASSTNPTNRTEARAIHCA